MRRVSAICNDAPLESEVNEIAKAQPRRKTQQIRQLAVLGMVSACAGLLFCPSESLDWTPAKKGSVSTLGRDGDRLPPVANLMLPKDDSFQALLQRVRDRCPAAARELSELYSGRILRLIRQNLNARLRSLYDLEDFLQEVWAAFFTRWVYERQFALQMARSRVIDTNRQRLLRQKYRLYRQVSLCSRQVSPHRDLVARQPSVTEVVISADIKVRVRVC